MFGEKIYTMIDFKEGLIKWHIKQSILLKIRIIFTILSRYIHDI